MIIGFNTRKKHVDINVRMPKVIDIVLGSTVVATLFIVLLPLSLLGAKWTRTRSC
jgi:hypothetical protein